MKSSPEEFIALLQKLVATPSFSREEANTALIIEKFFTTKSIESKRFRNNVIVKNLHYDDTKPTILLNSHHDTVRPNGSWRKDPFTPTVLNGKLYGLGSNDAGGSLVALIAAFLELYDREDMKYNVLLAATAEEEVSGKNGLELVLSKLGAIEFAIVGEPTKMQMATAEKGLMVLDCVSHGKAGHAARNEGENAIYKGMQDIAWFKDFQFEHTSELLGEVKMSVTMIEAGTQHNVVPDQCKYVVDVRSTDAYTNEEILDIIRSNIGSEVIPRSTRLQPSGLPKDHLLLQCARALGWKTYGSPTLSDQALMSFPSIKIGPGDSARSHTADEYIEIQELKDGIVGYNNLLNKILLENE
jgi:acetylornithine deacetylase